MGFVLRSFWLSLGWSAVAAATTSPLPASDTYLDSSAATTATDYSHANYGHFGAIKAVLNNNPNAGLGVSVVHSVFTLPDDFIGAAAGGVSSAVITFSTRTVSLNGDNGIAPVAATPVLQPLTTKYIAGDGGNSSKTKQNLGESPTAPNYPTQHGADWYSRDGSYPLNATTPANPWATPGGDYDSAYSAAATLGAGTATFDITAMINNPISRVEILTNGLLLRLAEDQNANFFASNVTFSLYSADTTSPGTITYAVPEPASLCLTGMGMMLAAGRRRRHDQG